jgi:hypothetical protein
MKQTKNTTAAERRIARRQVLADTLKKLADLLEEPGLRADGTVLREAATELLIGNTEILLAQPWESDPKPAANLNEPFGTAEQFDPAKPYTDAAQQFAGHQFSPARGEDWAREIKPGEVTVEPPPLSAVPLTFDDGYRAGYRMGREHAGTPQVTDAMVDRAVDGWQQWWNDHKGGHASDSSRAPMRHALEQALGVRS